MPNVLNRKGDRFLGEQFQTSKGYLVVDSFDNVVVPADTGILVATAQPSSGATVVTTGITNPVTPRTVRIKGNQASCTGDVIVVGTDIRGGAITDTIAAAGTSAVAGTRAFKTITSITIPTRGAPSDTISLGPGPAVGRSRAMPTDLGIGGTMDGVFEATRPTFGSSATVISLNTVSFNTAFNGARDYKVSYVSTELYGGNVETL